MIAGRGRITHPISIHRDRIFPVATILPEGPVPTAPPPQGDGDPEVAAVITHSAAEGGGGGQKSRAKCG